ncbi:unnamed protein product, partial [Allacma fusca]
TNSNLFFWVFPAQENPENAPVILWVNDIPGFSSLQGVFLETGPFELDENNVVKDRNVSWTKSHSMLYIDAPVGTVSALLPMKMRMQTIRMKKLQKFMWH